MTPSFCHSRVGGNPDFIDDKQRNKKEFFNSLSLFNILLFHIFAGRAFSCCIDSAAFLEVCLSFSSIRQDSVSRIPALTFLLPV